MKLDSKDCKRALEKYKVQLYVEQLAVYILLHDGGDLTKMANRKKMTSEDIEKFKIIVKRIRDNIGIEDEA